MKAVLLDRDGTIIVDPPDDRVDSVEKIRLLPSTVPALLCLAKHGYGIIIITNQTNIAQGRITEPQFWFINSVIVAYLESSGISVLKTYVCPHGTQDDCACRKPKPQLLLQAALEFTLNPRDTYMVGDRLSDIEAANNAKMKAVLVKTGKFPVVTSTNNTTYTADDLLDAAEFIVSHQSGSATNN
jgi:D-glycero-D-manno-heptose 1,7-bisphosphate phosphatase